MIRAFIFDLDGTLANTERLHFAAWQKTLLHNGVDEFSFTTFLRYVGTSNEKVAGDYIASHGLSKTLKQIIAEKQAIYMELIPEIELCPGAKELLERYQGKMDMAVASSSHQKEILEILRTQGLTDYFSTVIGGDMVTRRKPDPEIYLKVRDALQLQVSECLAFEDSGPGLAAAKNAGMYCIGIANEFTTDHDFTRADRRLGSFLEVENDLLKSLVLTAPCS